MQANESFQRTFGSGPTALSAVLPPDAAARLRAISAHPARSVMRLDIPLDDSTCYTISARQSSGDRPEHIILALRKADPSSDCARPPSRAADQYFQPMWNSRWLADTSLQMRTNLTAVTSMGQLLASTPLSAEQGLYVEDLANLVHLSRAVAIPLFEDVTSTKNSPSVRSERRRSKLVKVKQQEKFSLSP